MDSGLLDLRFARAAKKNWRSFAMADASGRQFTYGESLIGSLLIARHLRRRCRDRRMIGLLLPSSTGGALANIGVMMAGKSPVNLNFTAGREAIAAAIDQCRLQVIITSKLFLEKAKIEAP